MEVSKGVPGSRQAEGRREVAEQRARVPGFVFFKFFNGLYVT